MDRMYLLFLFKLHHKNGTSYFFICFLIPFVGKTITVYSVKYLKLEDTLLTHLMAYSIYRELYAFWKATIHREMVLWIIQSTMLFSHSKTTYCAFASRRSTKTIETCTENFGGLQKHGSILKVKRLLKLFFAKPSVQELLVIV